MRFGKLPEDVMSRRDLSSTAKLLYAALAMYRNGRTLQCNPSQPQLAEAIGMSLDRVSDATKELISAEVIVRYHRPGRGINYILPDLESAGTTPGESAGTTPGESAGTTPGESAGSPPANLPGHPRRICRVSPIKVSEQTIEQTIEQTPRTSACAWAREFVQGWNEAFPKSLNKHTDQLADEAAVLRAVEMEHKSLGDLQRIRDWLKSSGRISAYQRPARWFRATNSGVRVLDQIDMEMEADQARQAKRNGHPRASPPPQSREELRAFFERDEKERAEKKRQREEEKKDAKSAR